MTLPFVGCGRPWSTLAVTALATTALAVPVRHWLTRRGTVDIPNHRSSHTEAVPRGGGIAALAGAACGTLLTPATLRPRHTLVIVSMATLGWLDDVTGHLSSRLRLAAQLAAGAYLPHFSTSPRSVDAVVSAGVINVVNFMDGINGISGITGVIWGVNAMLIKGDGSETLTTLGALTAGACLGFLPHNAPHARLFLGDVGSYALGATFTTGILSQRTLPTRYQAGLPLLLYGADATYTILRRARRGDKLTEAHRQHVYQQLTDVGYSHSQVAAIHGTLAALICLINHHSSFPYPAAATGVITAAYLSLPSLIRMQDQAPG